MIETISDHHFQLILTLKLMCVCFSLEGEYLQAGFCFVRFCNWWKTVSLGGSGSRAALPRFWHWKKKHFRINRDSINLIHSFLSNNSLKSDSNLMQLARLTTKMEIRHPRNLFNCLFVSLFDDLIPLFPNRRMGWNYCIVDEFHVDVDCADSGDEEGNPDGRIVKHLAVERPQCVLGLLGVRKLHQTPILWRTTLQCYL